MREPNEVQRIREDFLRHLELYLKSSDFRLKRPELYGNDINNFKFTVRRVFENIVDFAMELEGRLEVEFDKAMLNLEPFRDVTYCAEWRDHLVKGVQDSFPNTILRDKEKASEAISVAYDILFDIYQDIVGEVYLDYAWYSIFIAVQDDVDLMSPDFKLQLMLRDYRDYFFDPKSPDRERLENEFVTRVFMYRKIQSRLF